ncbi:MAG: hypothetical protein U5K79_22675 [Cyclobacteriaceae bacterium]|nr:hypothetical protein [Cyclobacteriaceae bacterium]
MRKIIALTRPQILLVAVILTLATSSLYSQNLYTAKGYWEELNRKPYHEILLKQMSGDSLTVEQKNYLIDYMYFLQSYYDRMTEEEKLAFARMEEQWKLESPRNEQLVQEDFNLRARDRLVNGVYGLYYGASIATIFEMEGGGAVGVPLIMAGLWQLGPVINPKKYQNISVATIRAGNSGKILGALNGIALGLAVAGDGEYNSKWILGLSSVGSIAMGELMFQGQKKRNYTLGYIDIVRHHGFLGPVVTTLGYLSIDENTNLTGVSALAGGIGGLILGHKVAKRYDYSQGDADVISSLTWITTGLGGTLAVTSLAEDTNRGLILIPVASAIAGSVFGHRSVKGVHFNSRQGSTINLASGGAALVGLGMVTIAEAEEEYLYVGAASVCALVMHQVLYSSYKKKNLEQNLNIGRDVSRPLQFSMNVTPENYLLSRKLSPEYFTQNPAVSLPLVSMKLKF